MTASPSTYIIGVIMASFIIMGGIGFMTVFSDHDDTYLDDPIYSDFNETFNKYQKTQDAVDELGSALDTEPDWGVFGAINAMAQVAWNTLILLPTSFDFVNSAITGLSTVLGLPTWVGGTILASITVMIVFAIFGAVFNRQV